MRNAKIIGIVGIKGGVGKTTLTANLGNALANKFDKKVLLVDANSSTSDLALHLGLLDVKNSLMDVIDSTIPLREAVVKASKNLFFLSASLDNNITKLDKLRQYLNCLRPYYDFILIDASPSVNNEVLASMVAADTLITVTTPDHASLSCCLTSLRHAKYKMTPTAGLVLNKVRGKKFELDLNTIEEITGLPVLAELKYDKDHHKSVASMQPLVEYKPNHKNSKEFFKLAAAIVNKSMGVEATTRSISKVDVNRSLASF